MFLPVELKVTDLVCVRRGGGCFVKQNWSALLWLSVFFWNGVQTFIV